MTEITQANWEAFVTQSPKPVLVDFWAAWCGPCRAVAPELEKLANMRPDIAIGKVNVDEQAGLAQKYNISVIPTLVVFKSGREAGRAMGVKTAQQLAQLADSE